MPAFGHGVFFQKFVAKKSVKGHLLFNKQPRHRRATDPLWLLYGGVTERSSISALLCTEEEPEFYSLVKTPVLLSTAV